MTATHDVPAQEPPPVLREDTRRYRPHPQSVTAARHRTHHLLTEWGHSPHAHDAALIVSELSSNALLHGSVWDRLFQVRLQLTADSQLRIEVSDPRGERPLRPRTPAIGETFGRGLMIVEQLADRWGTAPRIVGKTVFAELHM